MSAVTKLQSAIASRVRPEDILKDVLAIPNFILPARTHLLIQQHANPRWPSYMNSDFRDIGHMGHILPQAGQMFPQVPLPSESDVQALQGYVRTLQGELGLSQLEYKTRLGRAARLSNPQVEIKGRYSYNKRVRLVIRLADKVERVSRNRLLMSLERMAKTKLVYQLDPTTVTHPATLAFLAYFVCRMGLRSQFTNTKQDRAFDEVSLLLLEVCERDAGTNWLQIAHATQDQIVLDRLTDVQKGELLARFYEAMVMAATRLKELADKGGIDHTSLIVRRGNDSSGWNAAAGAFNKARDGFMALVHALGQESLLDAVCPGKALRLMAADVVRWQTALEPNTAVYGELPRPWLVVLGKLSCTRADVEAALTKVQAEPATRAGWVTPRSQFVEVTKPTPDLAYGVALQSPLLAAWCRRAKIFSGKPVKPGRVIA